MEHDQRQSGAPRRSDTALLSIVALLALAVGLRVYQTSKGRRVRSYVAMPTVTAWIVGGLCVLIIALWTMFTSRFRRSYALVTAALILVIAGTAGHKLSRKRACDTGNARDLLQQMMARTKVKSPILVRQCVGERNAYFANWQTIVPRLSPVDHVAVVNFMDGYGLIDDDAKSPIAVTHDYEIDLSNFDVESTLVVSRRH